MRTIWMVGAALVAAALSGVGGAAAQSYNPRDALQGRLGSISCAEFTQMAPDRQAGLVRRMADSAPPSSLSSAVITPEIDSTTGQLIGSPNNGSTVPGTPLMPGQLIAACQAVAPSTTLRDAYVRFNSSPVPLTMP